MLRSLILVAALALLAQSARGFAEFMRRAQNVGPEFRMRVSEKSP